MDPPWSVDLLADLHAGALEPAAATRLWAQVNQDPQAQAVLRALDSTTGNLHELGAAPVPPMPAEFAARLDAAIANEARSRAGVAQGAAPVTDLAAARRKRNRRLSIGGGLVAAAAAVAAIAIAVIPGNNGGTTGGTAEPGNTPTQPGAGGGGALAVRSNDMGAALNGTQNQHDLGALKDEQTLAGCLQANKVPSNVQTVGVRPVTLDGHPAMLVVLTTGEAAKFRLLFVENSCSAGNPATIRDTTFGGVPGH
jgi:negative regulator of sigma E activity